MGARYPYYLLADSRDGQIKEAEVTRTTPSSQPVRGSIRHGFVYERVHAHHAQIYHHNAEIDVIREQWQAQARAAASIAERRAEGKVQEWEIPHEAEPSGRTPRRRCTPTGGARASRSSKRSMLQIAAKAGVRAPLRQALRDKKKARVAGPFNGREPFRTHVSWASMRTTN